MQATAAIGALIVIGSLAMTTVSAAGFNMGGSNYGYGRFGGNGGAMGTFGTVSSVSGDTITMTGRNNTTYTVDATNATVTKDGTSSSVSAINDGDTIVVQGTVSGDSITATTILDGFGGQGNSGGQRMGQGVFGTVASVNGTTLTVTAKFGMNGATSTVYTIDASNATVTKNGTSSSVSDINVGDMVMVQGTVSGTNVTATKINDGIGGGFGGRGVIPPHSTSTSVITGNGEPVIGGTVTAINGDTLTVTNKSNVTYTVDVTSATVEKGHASSSVSSIAVGDNVLIQGTVNGNSVTATSIIDSGSSTTTNAGGNGNGNHSGIFGGIGNILGGIGGIFHKIFGFF